MARCTVLEHRLAMQTQGAILKLWRKRKGLTLEVAAHKIGLIAEVRGIPSGSKKVPRSYVSLSRWEKGEVEMKELGLSLIAAAYGETVEAIRRPPPDTETPPRRQVEVPADQADAVEAFVEALNRRT